MEAMSNFRPINRDTGFLLQIKALFVEVLRLASTMGMLKMGTVALDGTKVHANASRHSALSYGHAKKIEKQLKREVQQLLQLAERADARDIPDGMSVPEELERRELRLAAIAEAEVKMHKGAQTAVGGERGLLAEGVYRSEPSGEKPEGGKCNRLIAWGRAGNHDSGKRRFAATPKAPPDSATPMQKMAHRMKTPRGRKLYALRKQTPEPVFGIIKSVMGYRQSLLRGLENVRGEWNLVTMSWNIKRMFPIQPSSHHHASPCRTFPTSL